VTCLKKQNGKPWLSCPVLSPSHLIISSDWVHGLHWVEQIPIQVKPINSPPETGGATGMVFGGNLHGSTGVRFRILNGY